MPTSTRLISLDDAERLAHLQAAGREFFAPWDPIRTEDHFTPEGQYAEVQNLLGRHRRGETLPHVILDENEQVIGRITLAGITRGPFQSCGMGYWVTPESNGRGHATAAVRRATDIAFDELGLHRVQAETLLHNERSQRVLLRAGFTRFGMAPQYLKIAGQWQDHLMFQLVSGRG